MEIHLTLNGQRQTLTAAPGESLLQALRRAGVWSVKHGCETGECGACAVLIDGALTPTCVTLAAQAEGRQLVTVESLAPGQSVHPLQQAFIDTGAIQSNVRKWIAAEAAKPAAPAAGAPAAKEKGPHVSHGGLLTQCSFAGAADYSAAWWRHLPS